jgi:ATP-binding cassette, subfamily D (ALD), member 3
MLFSIPASAVNSGMDYFQKLLGVSFRERITHHFHEAYLQKMFYYKICNLDSRISNPDQRLTQDAEKWASSLSTLYLNFTKPLLDMFLFSKKLAELVGWEGPLLTISWYFMSAVVIKLTSPPFGSLVAMEQKLEGEYRAKHSDLLNHSEEVAFYNGSEWEKKHINDKFVELINHVKRVLYKRFGMGIFESMLVKYGAVMIAYTVVGLPVFGPNRHAYLEKVKGDPTIITKDYVRNTNLLINLSKAIGRIVVSYKDVQNLSGYTTLINEMDEVLGDLKQNKFQRTQVTAQQDGQFKQEDMKLDKWINKG